MFVKIRNKLQSIQKDKHFFEVLSGSIWTFGAKILAVIIGLILNLTITRLYGAESMGFFALINAFFAFALIFSLMGTGTSVLRLIPEYTSHYSPTQAVKIYWKIIFIVVIISLFLTLFSYMNHALIAEVIFKHAEVGYLFALASFFIVMQALSILNTNALRAFKEIKLFAVFQVLSPVSKLLILLLLTYFTTNQYNPVYAVFYGHVLLMILSFLAIGYVIKKLYNSSSRLNKDISIKKINYISILTLSFPMFLTAAMHTIMTQTDIIMLGMMDDIKAVGIYAIAIKLAGLTSFVLGTVNTIAAPKFSELYHSGQMNELKNVAQKSSKLMFWSTLPIILIFILFGRYILEIFGEEYTVAYMTLLILILGQFVNAVVGSVGFLLDMTGYQKQLNIMVIFSGLVNIILNYILIPSYGIVGAALASAISLSLWNIIATFYIKNKFGFYIGYIPLIKGEKV